MRRRTVIISTIAVFAAIGLIIAFSGKGEEESGHGGKRGKDNKPPPVSVTTAQQGELTVYLEALGTITPRRGATLRPQVEGQLLRLTFEEGQRVKKGDLLAEIDPRPYEAQLKQAEGQKMRNEALLAEARTNLERYEILLGQDSIPRQQRDAQASLVKQYEGAVKNDQGVIDQAHVQLGYTRITAPFDGNVGLRQVDVGNIVHPSDANGIVIITETQPITALFTLPEDSAPRVLEHMHEESALTVEAWDRAGVRKLAEGILSAADNQVDATTGTVKFRAEFANKDQALFPGQFVNIRLHVATLHNTILIPVAALQRGTDGSYVYVVDEESKAQRRPVTPGPAEEERQSIEKGLAEGERVIIDGTDSVKEGGQVEVIEPRPHKE